MRWKTLEQYHLNTPKINSLEQLTEEFNIYRVTHNLPIAVAIRLCIDRLSTYVDHELNKFIFRNTESLNVSNRLMLLGLYLPEAIITQYSLNNKYDTDMKTPSQIFNLYDIQKNNLILTQYHPKITINGVNTYTDLSRYCLKSINNEELIKDARFLELLKHTFSEKHLTYILSTKEMQMSQDFVYILINLVFELKDTLPNILSPEEQNKFIVYTKHLIDNLHIYTELSTYEQSIYNLTKYFKEPVANICLRFSQLNYIFKSLNKDLLAEYETLNSCGLLDNIDSLHTLTATKECTIVAIPLPNLNI